MLLDRLGISIFQSSNKQFLSHIAIFSKKNPILYQIYIFTKKIFFDSLINNPIKMSKGAVKFSKEDELLLQDFSSAISKKNQLIFYGISAYVGVIPIYLFYGAHQMEVADSWFIWLAAALGVTYLLAQSYKNVKHVLKHQIVVKRGDAITREMNRLLADDKKMSKKEKDERILWKKNEVSDYEATLYTIFYNNVLFFALLIFLSFFVLSTITPVFNCLFSMLGSAGAVLLFSTSK